MKKALWTGLLGSVLMPVLATAQNALDGTWKIDVSKAQMTTKPEVYLLQGSIYNCKTCIPPIEIKADGQDQKVTGHPYYDTISVKILDDRTIERTEKKDGKIVMTSKSTVSSDGNTLIFEFTDNTATNSEPVTGKGESTRVAKGPAGAHAISGSWRASKMDNVSDNGLMLTFKVEGDTLTMTTPTGQAYTVKLNGTEAPYKGDPGITSVSVKRMGENTIEETDKRDGKVISVARISVAPDGKSMTIAVSDKLQGTTSRFVAEKQ